MVLVPSEPMRILTEKPGQWLNQLFTIASTKLLGVWLLVGLYSHVIKVCLQNLHFTGCSFSLPFNPKNDILKVQKFYIVFFLFTLTGGCSTQIQNKACWISERSKWSFFWLNDEVNRKKQPVNVKTVLMQICQLFYSAKQFLNEFTKPFTQSIICTYFMIFCRLWRSDWWLFIMEGIRSTF